MVYWTKGALQRNCRLKQRKTSFSPYWVFLFSRNPTKRFWGLIFWHFWAGRARHPGPPSQPRHVSLEFHNVGGWLTHGDLALDAGFDFLAIAEHRLIPAREFLFGVGWPRHPGPGSSIMLEAGLFMVILLMLVVRGLASVVCVTLSLLCLPLLLLSLSLSLTAVGLSGVCFLLGLVGLCTCLFFYGYQGADADAEQLALTEQLFDAAFGELCVVARGQPCLLVGDFNVEPTKIPCLAKGISAGLWVDLGGAWASGCWLAAYSYL